MMAFNVFSAINILAIVGHRAALNLMSSTPILLLFGGLTLLHLGLAAWKSGPKQKERVIPSASRRIAAWYIAISTGAFVATFAWLVTTTGP